MVSIGAVENDRKLGDPSTDVCLPYASLKTWHIGENFTFKPIYSIDPSPQFVDYWLR